MVVRRHDEAASEILVYTPDSEGLFSRITGALDRQRLNILDARIDTSADGFALDTFTVLDDSHAFAASDAALSDLADGLRTALAAPPRTAPAYHLRHPGSRQRFFASLPVQVSTDNDSIARYTVLEVVAPDRLGLLYRVGQALQELGLSIHGAKLSTFGERVEDTFFILRRDGKKVPEGELYQLRSRILVNLSSPDISPDRPQNGGKVA